VGSYVPVRVVRSHPNSLVGELAESTQTQDAPGPTHINGHG